MIHNYTDVIQKRYCGEEPAVRFVSFIYDKKDGLAIGIKLMTSMAEHGISGDVMIILDEYDLDYTNTARSKQYEENLELEIENRALGTYRSFFNLVNLIFSNITSKRVESKTVLQYWNAVDLLIESEDEILMMESKDIRYLIFTEGCVLDVYPSISQTKELHRFLKKD